MHPKTSAILLALGIVLIGSLLVAAGYQTEVIAYYAGQQLEVSVLELDPRVVRTARPQHRLYDCDHCEPDGQVYVSIIDDIKGEGNNPLWRGIQIEFNPGHPCRQFTSEAQIAEAVAGGQISLSATNQLFRCEVVKSSE